jgi:hypothetical protein
MAEKLAPRKLEMSMVATERKKCAPCPREREIQERGTVVTIAGDGVRGAHRRGTCHKEGGSESGLLLRLYWRDE